MSYLRRGRWLTLAAVLAGALSGCGGDEPVKLDSTKVQSKLTPPDEQVVTKGGKTKTIVTKEGGIKSRRGRGGAE